MLRILPESDVASALQIIDHVVFLPFMVVTRRTEIWFSDDRKRSSEACDL